MTVTTGPRRVDLRSICALKPPGRAGPGRRCTVRCWAGISRDVEQMTAIRRLVGRSDAAVLGRSVLEGPCCSYVPRCRAVGTPELPPVFAPVSVAGVTLAPFLRYKLILYLLYTMQPKIIAGYIQLRHARKHSHD